MDADGSRWEVLELQWTARGPSRRLSSDAWPAGGSSALFFVSRDEARRCDSVPADWPRMSAAGLRYLCAAATPVPVRNHEHLVLA
jgi:hypothetical protein